MYEKLHSYSEITQNKEKYTVSSGIATQYLNRSRKLKVFCTSQYQHTTQITKHFSLVSGQSVEFQDMYINMYQKNSIHLYATKDWR